MSEERKIDRQTLRRAVSRTAECLSMEQLERVIETGEATDPAQRNHLLECLFCQTELSMLRTFLTAEAQPDEGAAAAWIASQLEKRGVAGTAARSTPAAFPWWSRVFGLRSILAASALAVLLFAITVLRHEPKEPELQARLSAGGSISRSQQVMTVSPKGDLQTQPSEFQWKPFPGAAAYVVDVMEIDGGNIWSERSSAASIQVPSDVRRRIIPAKTLMWKVTALDAAGKNLAESSVERFRLTTVRGAQ